MSELDPRLAALSPEKRKLLALLQQKKAQQQRDENRFVTTRPFELISASDRLKLPPDVVDAYPLGTVQLGMMFHMNEQRDDNAPPDYHNVASYWLKFNHDFQLAAFQQAVDRVVAHEAILRTAFNITDYSVPLQLVYGRVELPVIYEDLQGLDEAQQDAQVKAFIQRANFDLFDLAVAPLQRYFVHQLSPRQIVFTISEPHSISDGWSTHLTLVDLIKSYYALIESQDYPLEPVATSYADFIRAELEISRSAAARAFWQEQLARAVPTQLPPRAEDGSGARFGEHRQWVELPAPVIDGLNRLVSQVGLPMKSVLLAAHCRVLALLSGQDQVTTGLAFNGRLEVTGGTQVRGLFLNMLPVTLDVSGGSWLDLIRQAHQVEVAMLPYRRYPLGQLQRENGNISLFDTAFNYLNFHSIKDSGVFDEAKFECVECIDHSKTNYDYNPAIYVDPVDSRKISYVHDANLARFSVTQLEQFASIYLRVIEDMALHPQEDYRRHDFLTAAERSYLLKTLNDTAYSNHGLAPVTVQLEQQVQRSPDAAALIHNNTVLSYTQFNQRVNQLAQRLIEAGAGEGQIIALCLPRSVDLVVAIWACLKSGAAYLPLDAQQPLERLAAILSDSQPLLVLSQQTQQDLFKQLNTRLAADQTAADQAVSLMMLDADDSSTDDIAAANPPLRFQRDQAHAYVLYTSGSTGQPKGVLSSHRGLINRIDWMQRNYPLSASDHVLQKTPYTFDVSVWEFIWPLLHGASLVLADDQGHKDPAYLAAVIKAQQITVLHFVPSMLEIMLEQQGWADCRSVRCVFCSGEALSRKLQDHFQAQAGSTDLYNLYGPTEASIDVSSWHCRADSTLSQVPIGTPISNTQLVVLDQQRKLMPFGCIGELCIGGVGLASGYLNQAALTAEKFVHNPFAELDTQRLYRTGDLARYIIDPQTGSAQLVYHGRVDDQVKLRGQRVELGEIAAAFERIPAVSSAVVKLFKRPTGADVLVAYAVLRDAAQSPWLQQNWRSAVQANLPDYMIPATLVVMEQWPLSASGKINRRALAEPELAPQTHAYREPRNAIEAQLCQLWQQMLGVTPVGIDDNFFALGGNSMQAIRLIYAAKKQGLKLSIGDLWQYPSIAELAARVQLIEADDEDAADAALAEAELPLLPAQAQLLESGLVNPHHFNTATLVEVPIQLDYDLLRVATEQLFNSHSALRMRFIHDALGWRQQALPSVEIPLEIHDLNDIPVDEQAARVREKIIATQGSLNIFKAELVRIVLFHFGGGKRDQILFICHHLVTDSFSFATMVQRFGEIYKHIAQGRLAQGDVAALPYRDDYLSAVRGLKQLANDPRVMAEFAYWDRFIPSEQVQVPSDFPDAPAASSYTSMVFAEEQLLARDSTRQIMKNSVLSLKVQSVTLVLYAMSRAMRAWGQGKPLLIGMGRYGREIYNHEIDLSQTLGWHSMTIPVMVQTRDEEHCLQDLQVLDQQLRDMPYSGTHYGLLRYLCDDPQIRTAMLNQCEPKITLNYSPENPDNQGQAFFQPVDMALDPYIDPANCNLYDMSFWVRVINGQLGVNIQYNRQRYRAETVNALIARCVDELERLNTLLTSAAA